MTNLPNFADRCVAMLFAFLACGMAIAVDDTNEEHLIGILESEAPRKDKAITCKRLAVYGTSNSVPVLASLLSDKELASWARIALESIPGSEADEALQNALDNVNGRLLVGVINSLATRRNEQAVDGLAKALDDQDHQVASAAAVALGHIGNPVATKALTEALANSPMPVRSAVAEGCILAAERMFEAGKLDEAADLYDKVRETQLPKQRILEATRGAILARKADGLPLLVEQLESGDKKFFGIGLRTSRELESEQVTEAIVSQLAKVSVDRQSLLILALADRDDNASLPAVLRAASESNPSVRKTAIDVLGRSGDVSCIPTLLNAAVSGDSDISGAAMKSLEILAGDEIDRALTKRLEKSTGKMRRTLIDVVGRRRINAVPYLVEAADDADAQIRNAALLSLGATIGPENLSWMIDRVVSHQPGDNETVLRKALLTASVRMPDREACATQLGRAMEKAGSEAKSALLNVLGRVGGRRALQAVGKAAQDTELQDEASQILGKWMTADAAPVLLKLAKPTADDKYRIRALRGFIRIARQFDLPGEQRQKMCRQAMKVAARDDERMLVLQVIERYPCVEGLELAVETAKAPSLKNDAIRVCRVIAKEIDDSEDVQRLLAQVGKSIGAGSKPN